MMPVDGLVFLARRWRGLDGEEVSFIWFTQLALDEWHFKSQWSKVLVTDSLEDGITI